MRFVPKIDDDDDAKVVINTCGSGIALGPVGGMPSRRSYTYECGRERIVSRVLPPPCSSQSEKEKVNRYESRQWRVRHLHSG